MKKIILSLILACSAFAANAMSYERAREEARFITDKMAYELNLNDAQYNDCYEINLDYLLSLSTEDDLIYGNYLAYRNADLRHILFDWQWTIFAAADYFLNPVSWYRGAWHFPIYRHYRVGYFYYDHPRVFWSYRGGHGRFHYHTGYYVSRRPHHWGGGFRGHDRGPIGHHSAGRYGHGINYRDSRGGGNHHSTYQGGGRAGNAGRSQGYSIGGSSHHDSGSRSGNTPSGRSSYQHESSTRTTVHNNGFSSGSGRASSSGRSAGSFSGSSRSAGSFSSPSRSAGSFSGSSRSSGSFSGGASRGGGSFSGGGSSRGGSSRGGGRGGR